MLIYFLKLSIGIFGSVWNFYIYLNYIGKHKNNRSDNHHTVKSFDQVLKLTKKPDESSTNNEESNSASFNLTNNSASLNIAVSTKSGGQKSQKDQSEDESGKGNSASVKKSSFNLNDLKLNLVR